MPQLSPIASRSLFGLIFAMVAFAAVAAVDWYSAVPQDALRKARYVGRETCAKCHQQEHADWTGSHHDRAMEVASDETVLGDFNDAVFSRFGVETRFFRRDGKFMVNAEGPNGEHRDYEVKWTFGIDPLQQYMVELHDGPRSDGRVQVLRVSWDTRKNQWFYVAPIDVRDERLLPGDPLHWTGMGQNWNTMCAACHSTDLKKNFDFETNSYHTEFFEIDVSCEACHGPGSVHVELAESKSLFWDRRIRYGLTNPLKTASNAGQAETCAPCHSRRAAIHENYRAGESFLDYYNPQLLAPGLYYPDGQILDEVYVYGSFLQSRMYRENVRCTDCHNPHSLELKFEGNALCTQCHTPGKYDGPGHHHHATDKAVEAGATACVNCHMPSRTYMEIDDRRDHSLRVPRPDLSVELGTPNACNDCHTSEEEDAAWAAEQVRKWYGDKRPDDPHYAPALAAGRAGDPDAVEAIGKLLKRKKTPDIVRATAVELLAPLAAQPSQEWVEDALDHDSPLVRAAAVRALTPPPSAEMLAAARANHQASSQLQGLVTAFVDKLAPLLRDPVRLVRMAAAARLVGVAEQIDVPRYRSALDAAIEEYVAGQAMHLDRAGAHHNLAELDAALGDLDGAIQSMRNAIRQEDYLSGLRSQLASLLERRANQSPQGMTEAVAEEVRGLREEEAELLLRDQKLLPRAAGPHYQRGMLLYLLGRGDEARKELLAACRLGPNDYGNWLGLALLCQQQERWDQAVKALERMEQLRPGSPDVRNIYRQIRAAIAAERSEAESAESDQR